MKTINPESENLWTKAPVANLVRYEPSGIYFARAKVRGKLVRKSLDTNILSVAKLRLADVVDAEHRAVAPSQTKIVGKMTFGDALAIFRERQKHATDIKESTKNYNERAAIDLLKTWTGLEQTDVKRITKFDCLEWRSRFGKMYASTVINGTLSVLRRILDIAVDSGVRYDNPAKDKDVKRARVRRKELKLPEPDQFVALLAQKRDKRFYPANAVIVFNRETKDFAKGEVGTLLKATPTHLLVQTESKIQRVPFKLLNRLTVCQPVEMTLAKGDQLQLKANAPSLDGKELINGELVTVAGVNRKGQIQLKDGRVLPENYREFVRGYAITSYGSQGKTVEHVLFSDSSVKAATNNQQWLVTISRGTRAVKIFTQDKAQLRENVGRLGDRELAIEFAKQDSAQSRRMPPPVRKYIAGLIQSRRSVTVQIPIEKIDLWKHKQSPRMTPQRTPGQRV